MWKEDTLKGTYRI